MNRTLVVASPVLRGTDVKYATRLLVKGGFLDDVSVSYGKDEADGTRRAKYLLGYPKTKINGAFGTVLERYLRDHLDMPSGEPVPHAYLVRRQERIETERERDHAWETIGPVTPGGRSLLDFSLTHRSHGLPENAASITLWPAVDVAWGAGTVMIAPEDCVVDTRDTDASPGDALYLTGESEMRYWLAHGDRDYPLGKEFKKGDFVWKTVPTTIGGGPHGHVGVNAEALLGVGKQFKYGRTGVGPDYTLGSPTMRDQLVRDA